VIALRIEKTPIYRRKKKYLRFKFCVPVHHDVQTSIANSIVKSEVSFAKGLPITLLPDG